MTVCRVKFFSHSVLWFNVCTVILVLNIICQNFDFFLYQNIKIHHKVKETISYQRQ